MRGALLAAIGAALLALPACGAVDCHKDCTKRGNCNAETGECQCPFGYAGKHCEIDKLSACRTQEGAEAMCNYGHAQNCHCWRQCWDFHCLNTTDWDGQVKVLCERGFHPPWPENGCYVQEGVPLEQQRSTPPEKGQTGFKFYMGIRPDAPEQTNQTVAMSRPHSQYEVLAPTACPKKCGPNALCVVDHGDQRGPYCRCHRSWEGDTCETRKAAIECPLACSGRGKCLDWFCHCDPPYWGLGCERGPDSAVPKEKQRGFVQPTDFKIYMYELPSEIAYPMHFEVGEPFYGRDWLYGAFYQFLEQFLTSAVRTYDPTEAHLFYVPALQGSFSGATPDCLAHLAKVLEYVQHTYPYWNRTDGKDHFLFTPADRGSCALPNGTLAEKAIKLTHFGYYFKDSKNSTMHSVRQRTTTPYSCYLPQRDVVVVPMEHRPGNFANASSSMSLDEILEKKKGGPLLFFGGDIPSEGDAFYDMSGGARQTLYQLWNESWGRDKELLLFKSYSTDEKNYEYEDAFRTSRFCYTPYGWGWGIRLPQAITANCIPVIIQTHVFQYFEDVLPYETFSIRLSMADIPQIREILKSVSDEQYRYLMGNLVRYRNALHWIPEAGGQAFSYTVASLRRRYMNLKAKHY